MRAEAGETIAEILDLLRPARTAADRTIDDST